MKIFSNTVCSQKTLTIQLVNSLNVSDPHIELLQSVIDLVDSIILDYSLDNLYPDVCKLIKPSETDKDVKYSETFPSRPTPNQMEMISDSILITSRNDGRRNFTLNFNSKHLTDEHIRCLQPCIPYLEKLYINGNREISSKSMTLSDVLMEVIHTNGICSLKSIDIGFCDLTDEHIASIQTIIPFIEHLGISGNYQISATYMKNISDIVMQTAKNKNDCKLISLDVSFCDLTDEHILCLKPCIPYMKYLCIGGNNRMSANAIKHISGVIKEAINTGNICNLKSIDASFASLNDGDIACLQPSTPYLENLFLAGNKEMSSQSMTYISDAIIQSNERNKICNIKTVDVSKSGLTDEHIELLKPCIPYMEDINLNTNCFMSSKSMKCISDNILRIIEIQGMCKIKKIDVSSCNLTDKHIELLQPCIPTWKISISVQTA